VSQAVTLAEGSYQMTVWASQRGNMQQRPQSIQILIDGKGVGLCTPSNRDYTLLKTGTFTLNAGMHLVALKGVTAGDSTALFTTVRLLRGPSLHRPLCFLREGGR